MRPGPRLSVAPIHLRTHGNNISLDIRFQPGPVQSITARLCSSLKIILEQALEACQDLKNL